MMNFLDQLTTAEFNKCFTLEGQIERYKELCRVFAETPSIEMSCICDAAATVLHEKYNMDWDEIETLESEVE